MAYPFNHGPVTLTFNAIDFRRNGVDDPLKFDSSFRLLTVHFRPPMQNMVGFYLIQYKFHFFAAIQPNDDCVPCGLSFLIRIDHRSFPQIPIP